MYQLLFRNRWLALIFVALTLLSVYTIVGSGEEGGVLTRAAKDIAEQRNQMEEAAQEVESPAAPEDPPVEFLPDEELIDDTQGLDSTGFDPSGSDPTPQDQRSAEQPSADEPPAE